MKIMIISNYWKSGLGGGISTYLANLAGALKQHKGIQVKVIYTVGDDVENHKVSPGILLFPLQAFRILLKEKPDVVHTQDNWLCILPGYLYKRIAGARLVHTFHTEMSLSPYGRRIFQFFLNRCDCVTFVSKGLRKKFEEGSGLTFRHAGITYGGSGAEPVSGEQVRQFRKQFGIKDDSVVLLALGLTALKYKAEGAKLLIQAVKRLHAARPELLLVLTREAAFTNELREYAKAEGVSDRVIFTGNVDSAFVPLNACTIYTHISLGEGLPIAMLEAMAVGKPIIATKVGGIPEAIESGLNGILVEPDVGEIVDAVDRLLGNKEYAEMLGANAKLTIEERFTWERSASHFLSVYGQSDRGKRQAPIMEAPVIRRTAGYSK